MKDGLAESVTNKNNKKKKKKKKINKYVYTLAHTVTPHACRPLTVN